MYMSSTCDNDCVDRWDRLGLKWTVFRETSMAKAPAWCECGDTFDDLARMLGLDTSDYKTWADTADNTPQPFKPYLVPNTVYFDFGEMFKLLDPVGPIPRWRDSLYQLASIYRGRKFKVVLTDPSDPSTARGHLQSDDIYGFAYAGHGGGGDAWQTVGLLVFRGGEGETSLDSSRYSRYGINFLYALGCSTATRDPIAEQFQQMLGWKRSPWERNVATRGLVFGVWGEANGYQAWNRLVQTPGTNRK